MIFHDSLKLTYIVLFIFLILLLWCACVSSDSISNPG